MREHGSSGAVPLPWGTAARRAAADGVRPLTVRPPAVRPAPAPCGRRPSRARTRRRAASGMVVAAGCALCLSACLPPWTSDQQGAQEQAADRARALAEDAKAYLPQMVAEDDAATGPAVLTLLQGQAPGYLDESAVFLAELVDRHTVRLEAAFDGAARTGRGATTYDYRARLCVQYVITAGDRPGDEPDVGMRDVACRARPVEGYGEVRAPDGFTRLHD